MTNVNEVFEMVENEVDHPDSILKDRVPLNVTGLTTWLEQFRQTHYRNRSITKQFWDVCFFSIMKNIDVRSILGEEILSELKTVNPKFFDSYLSRKIHVY